MRYLHIHLGPHKTGSTSIQDFLKDHLSTDILTANNILYIHNPIVKELGKALQNKDWEAASGAATELRELLMVTQAKTIVISSEDLSGGLVGRSGTRRVYPRLFENVKLLDEVLSDIFSCTFYFFLRDEDDWLRSVYNQNLKHRESAIDFDQFSNSVKGNRSWTSVLRKVRNRLEDRFVILPYTSFADGSVVQRFVEAALPKVDVKNGDYSMYQSNKAPDLQTAQTLEVINRSHASAYAKRNARRTMTSLARTEPHADTLSSVSGEVEPYAGIEGAPDWPPEAARPSNLPNELSPLWDRAKARITYQEQPNLLPDLSVDFKQSSMELTEGEEVFPSGGRQDMRHQERILRHRFRGLPLVCFYNAFAISYLRRSTPHTEHARQLFFHLWDTEFRMMLATLPTRWLISVLQTFMDHGKSEAQRHVGTAGYFFSNTLKAYEAERALEGHAANNIYRHVEPATKSGFDGLDRFALGNTDLMLNLLACLLEASARDEASGRVLHEFLLRTRSAHTLFSRMDQSRIHHNAHVKGFENCWSFFEEPKKRT